MALSKTTITSGIWKLFKDRINSQVTTATLSDGTVITRQLISAAFPDKVFDEKDNYPIFIINQPEFTTDFFTYGKTIVDGTIDIDLFTTQSLAAESFTDQVIATIEAYRPTLAASQVYDVQVEDIDTDMYTRGSIKVHSRTIKFRFKYVFARTE